MQQARDDGATVAIYYEDRLAKLGLKASDLLGIDAEVNELAEDEEEDQQAHLKNRWAALESVVSAAPAYLFQASQVKQRLENRFKDRDDPLRLVIVRDMWLTGFNAPCVHTLYVDKPMKGHKLMQAIARVNRGFRDKQGGLVVDYIGIANDLKQVLKEYTASKERGRPTIDAHEAFAVLEEKLDVLRAMLHGFDYS